MSNDHQEIPDIGRVYVQLPPNIGGKGNDEAELLSKLGGAYEQIKHWGGLVMKTIIGLNVGGLVTLAALYTDPARAKALTVSFDLTVVCYLAGLFLGLVAASAAYFNGGALQKYAQCGLAALREPDAERARKFRIEADRHDVRVGHTQTIAVAFIIIAGFCFFGGTVVGFVSL